MLGEIMTTMEKIDWLLSYGEQTLAPSARSSPMLLIHKKSTVSPARLPRRASMLIRYRFTMNLLASWQHSFPGTTRSTT